MTDVLIYLVIALFLAMLFLNVYFRVKVFKIYKRLVQNRVEFNSSHVMSPSKMEAEILPKYPKHKEDILTFVSHIKFSIRIAFLLIVLIIIAGLLLRQ